MKRKGKIVALWTGAVTIVVLVAAGIAAKDRIRDEWSLLRLKSGDKDVRHYAAEELGNSACVRAVPAILEAARQEDRRDRIAFHNALVRIGKPAAPALLDAASEGPGPLWDFALEAIGDIFNNDFQIHRILQPTALQAARRAEFVRFLDALLYVGREKEEVLQAVADAMKKIQGKPDEAQR